MSTTCPNCNDERPKTTRGLLVEEVAQIVEIEIRILVASQITESKLVDLIRNGLMKETFNAYIKDKKGNHEDKLYFLILEGIMIVVNAGLIMEVPPVEKSFCMPRS